jgi:hypothetical protein
MGTTPGNRIVIGTDVVYHNPGHPTNIHLIEDGIEYAGAQASSTGVYFDTSCVQDGVPGNAVSSVLNSLSDPSASGSWSTFLPPCTGAVSLIARDPAFTTSGADLALTTTDLASWGCSVHESFPTFKSDWSPLAIATDPSLPSHPTCGSDPDTGASSCGQAYILIAGIGTPLDHFKCYVPKKPIVVHPTGSSIQLQDQFDGAKFEKAKVVQLYRFCNPVQKQHGHTVTPILHKQLHLAIYSISAHPTVNHTVLLRNQFGTQKITVGSPHWLGVPTSKNSHAQPDPTLLNHFKCYPVLHSKPVNIIVTLTDQWHTEPKVKVGKPFMFCNPALKVHAGKKFPLVNTVAHLVSYQLTAKPFSKSAYMLNQFNATPFSVTGADLLCVPSVKLAYAPVPITPVKPPKGPPPTPQPPPTPPAPPPPPPPPVDACAEFPKTLVSGGGDTAFSTDGGASFPSIAFTISPNPAWNVIDGTSWISLTRDGSSPSSSSTTSYRRSFNVSQYTLDHAVLAMSGSVLADNSAKVSFNAQTLAQQPSGSPTSNFKTPTPFDYQGSPGKTNFQLSDNLDFTVTDEGEATGVDYSVMVTCRAVS